MADAGKDCGLRAMSRKLLQIRRRLEIGAGLLWKEELRHNAHIRLDTNHPTRLFRGGGDA